MQHNSAIAIMINVNSLGNFDPAAYKDLDYDQCESALEQLHETSVSFLIRMTELYDPSDADSFARLIQRIVEKDGDTSTLARFLGVAVSTVHRWRVGDSLPHQLMRSAIKEHITKYVRERDLN